MAIDKQTIEEITNILGAHDISSNGAEETKSFLSILINKLGEHSSTKNVSIDEALSYHRNLAEACSALSTFCKDRNLKVLYNPEKSKFCIYKS